MAFSKNALDIWILAGQSNMEGCGALNESLASDKNVFSFGSDWKWRTAKDPLHDLLHSTDSVDWDLRLSMMPPEVNRDEKSVRAYWKSRTLGIGAGLGIAFGKAWAKGMKRKVGLISAAHGGTNLEEWSPTKKSLGKKSLYGAMLLRAQAASGRLRGILWYQGESDANPERMNAYEEGFVEWVRAARTDLGMPNLPVIAVQLGNVVDPVRDPRPWEKIREVQLALEKKISNYLITTAVDLSLNDIIHIDGKSLIRLGRRMAHLALNLNGSKSKKITGPRFVKSRMGKDALGYGEIVLTFSGVSGQLLPERPMLGFEILDASGRLHPTRRIFQSRRGKRGNEILLRTNQVPEKGDKISYGRGLAPVCNVIDEKDLALPAFQTVL